MDYLENSVASGDPTAAADSVAKPMIESLVSYAKSLTSSRSFAHYYVELAINEFLEHGGRFASGHDMRRRLFEAFHRVWRGACATIPDGSGNGGVSLDLEVALRRAATLLSRHKFSSRDIAGMLHRPVAVIRNWLSGEDHENGIAAPVLAGLFARQLWPEPASEPAGFPPMPADLPVPAAIMQINAVRPTA